MNLIDRDKFLTDVKSRKYSKKSLALIESQPEIKAIPIEWILNWSDRTFNRPIWSDPGYRIVIRLVEDWEKENEKGI